MVWTSLRPCQRLLETERWKEWAEEGITNLQAITRYTEWLTCKSCCHMLRLCHCKALSLRQHFVHMPRTYIMSESPELSGKRKWISEQRADPPPGA
eukprot:2154937-Amphidinium_carterae.2